MTTLAELGEWALIDRIAAGAGQAPAGALGIGDDAAVLPAAGALVVATDLLVEGVHFRRTTAGPADVGWKALAVNLSDMAAMGARPRAVLVGLALPGGLDAAWVDGFYAGLGELAGRHDVWLAGGDTTGSPGPIMVAITVLGAPGPAGTTLRRADARPGDVLFHLGSAGLAAAGLACLERAAAVSELPDALRAEAIAVQRRPTPLVAEGRALAALGLRLALMDDSDGLARSARLLAAAAGVDVVLEASALPIAEATRAIAARLDADPLAWALTGGEDYGLLGSCAPNDWPAVAAVCGRARKVGAVRAPADPTRPMALLRRAEGREEALAGEVGYAHFAQTSFPPR